MSTKTGRFQVIQFNWGYAESSRIVPGPLWVYLKGFDTAPEALESFRAVLQEGLKSTGCPKHGWLNSKFCSQCGLPAQNIPATPHTMVEWFNSLWTMDTDDFSEQMDMFQDSGWEEIWDYDLSTILPENRLSVENTEQYLLGSGRYVCASSQDKKRSYSWGT